jgi:hypothetical protein
MNHRQTLTAMPYKHAEVLVSAYLQIQPSILYTERIGFANICPVVSPEEFRCVACFP